MNFNTVQFLFAFLPVVLVVFYLSPPRWRLLILSISSVIFYGAAGIIPLTFMIVSVAWALCPPWPAATVACGDHWREVTGVWDQPTDDSFSYRTAEGRTIYLELAPAPST